MNLDLYGSRLDNQPQWCYAYGMRTAVGYIRVSGLAQVDQGGPDRQRDAIQRYAAEHEFYLAAIYSDDGVSGTIDAPCRPGFQQLLIDLAASSEEERPRAVILERADRLARDLIVAELAIRELKKLGVEVHFSDVGRVDNDQDDHSRRLIRQIVGAIAEWEKCQIMYRLNAGKARKKGQYRDGPRPFGWHAEDWALLCMAFERRLAGAPVQEQLAILNKSSRTWTAQKWRAYRYRLKNYWPDLVRHNCPDASEHAWDWTLTKQGIPRGFLLL